MCVCVCERERERERERVCVCAGLCAWECVRAIMTSIEITDFKTRLGRPDRRPFEPGLLLIGSFVAEWCGTVAGAMPEGVGLGGIVGQRESFAALIKAANVH